MDYKTNILSRGIEANDMLLPEINGLYFGVLGERQAVFDYTRYFEENDIKPIDYKAFMRMNKHYIETIIKPTGAKTTSIFYQNADGHILVTAELVFLFLAFANPEICIYFNQLITDVINDGVAYSNGFIYSMASEKLPSEELNEIIINRANENTGDE